MGEDLFRSKGWPSKSLAGQTGVGSAGTACGSACARTGLAMVLKGKARIRPEMVGRMGV